MKTTLPLFFALFALLPSVFAQGTSFTYQGRLTDNGAPAQGIHDLRFTIYDTGAAPGGNVIAGPLVVPAVGINDGLFTAKLDFGAGVFDGGPRWLEISVSGSGSAGVFTTLLPRQPITSAPYAIRAAGISGTLPDEQLSANVPRLNTTNTFTSPVTFRPANGSPFAIAGSSSNKLIKGLNAERLGGKTSTDFVAKAGDTMTGPLILPANGLAVGTTQLVFTADGNIGIGTTTPQADLDVQKSFKVGSLRIHRSGIGGGAATKIYTDADINDEHLIFGADSRDDLVIRRENGNVGIGTTTPTVPFEVYRSASGVTKVAHFGGNQNFEGEGAAISIGTASVAGNYSAVIAAINERTAPSFLNQAITFSTMYLTWRAGTEVERMRISASGNVGIGTGTPAAKLHVVDANIAANQDLLVCEAQAAQGESPFQIRFGFRGNVPSIQGNRVTVGSQNLLLNPDGGFVGIGVSSPSQRLDVAGSVRCTSVFQTSDRNAKEHFAPVSGREVLERLIGIPIQKWNFTNDTAQTRHIGPMAQDFHAAFGVGADDKHIATVDADGVALAAIQGLYEVVREKDARITKLEAELAELKRAVQSLARGSKEN